MSTENKSNEINLLDIFVYIGRGMAKISKWTINLLGKCLQLLYRNIIITSILTIIGFGISQYFARSSNQQYEMGSIAYLNGVSATTIKQIGCQLLFNSKENDFSSLSMKLNLPKDIANKLIKVDFFDVIDYQKDRTPDVIDFKREHLPSDTLNVKMENIIYINLTLIGKDQAEKLGNAFLSYLNNNQIAQANFKSYITSLEARIKITNAELNRLDSLAKVKYFKDNNKQLKFENNQLTIGNQNTQLFWADMLKLQDIKSQAEKQLRIATTPVVLPSNLVLNPQPINGRVKYGIIGLLIGLLFAIVIEIIKENHRKWLNFLKRK